MEKPARSVTLQLTGWNGTVGAALLLNRLSLGGYFLGAGLDKIRMGPAAFYQDVFLSMRPPWLPEFLALPFGYSIPFLEVVVGVLLAVGLFTRVTGTVAAVLLVIYTAALILAGMFFSGPGPFHYNVVFFTVAVLLAAAGPGRYSVDFTFHRRKVAHLAEEKESARRET